MTKIDRVLTALQEGEELTARQIEARFGVGNARALVSSLRDRGFAVYSNPRMNSKGQVKSFYRLGTPSRDIVAAGYRAMRAA